MCNYDRINVGVLLSRTLNCVGNAIICKIIFLFFCLNSHVHWFSNGIKRLKKIILQFIMDMNKSIPVSHNRNCYRHFCHVIVFNYFTKTVSS